MCEWIQNAVATDLRWFELYNYLRVTKRPLADIRKANSAAENRHPSSRSPGHSLWRIPKYQCPPILSILLRGRVGFQDKGRLISLAIAMTGFGQTAISYCGKSARRRSRSAANAKQARISSRVKSGKSSRISCSVIPDAKYSKTS